MPVRTEPKRLTASYYFYIGIPAGEKGVLCLAGNSPHICHSVMQITNDVVSPPGADESIGLRRRIRRFSTPPHYVATATEAVNNYRGNPGATWYKDNADPNDPAGKYAFQRLRQTWFIPHVAPKFKLHRQDKFYAIGSCFARGIENALAARKMIVESAAPEFAKLQPVNREVQDSGLPTSTTPIQS